MPAADRELRNKKGDQGLSEEHRIDVSPKSKLHHKVSNLLALTTALLALPVGSALAQEWTLDAAFRLGPIADMPLRYDC